MIGCSDVSLGFGGSSEPRGAGPALPGGPVSDRAVAPPDRLAPEPGPERAGGGAGHRLRAALGRRGRAPLRRGWAGRPGRPAARERGRQAAAGGRGRGGAAGRAGRAARRRRAVDGGLWTGPKVAAWMATRLGRKVWPQRGWDYLRRLGHSPQVPRPRHAKAASPEEQAEYKKVAHRAPARPASDETSARMGAVPASRLVRAWCREPAKKLNPEPDAHPVLSPSPSGPEHTS